jgi:hypothetical protein
MPNPDLLDIKVRRQILEDIRNEDNLSRKREHQKRFDVFRERQDIYILERLRREFGADTVDDMRKILSINLSKRIIEEEASIYRSEPERTFSTTTEREVTDSEQAQIDNLYEILRVNEVGSKSNKVFKLHDQGTIMCVPDMKGSFKLRAISPLHYDVIPQWDDPETAFAYILNVWDFDLNKTARDENNEKTQTSRYRQNNRTNEIIADRSDRLAVEDKYIVWTDEIHFTMDGDGNFISEVIPNPIGRLPFVDVADDKDFEFFVRKGTSVVDFALDVGLALSDLANIIRLQGYAQAVISSDKQPVHIKSGPNGVIWLKTDPNNPGSSPKFEFVSPNPDLNGSLEFLESIIKMFLSSRGVDPATISGKGEAKSFSSGVERLLAMLDKFEATKSDFSLYKSVEIELFEILKKWSNVFQDVVGDGELREDLRLGKIGDDVFLDINFSEPSTVQTQSEKEDSVIKLSEAGFMSRVEAIMELRGVSKEAAESILEEIDEIKEEEMESNPLTQNLLLAQEGQQEESEEEQEEEDEGSEDNEE